MIGIVYGYCVKHGGIGRYVSEYLKNIKKPSNFELITLEKDMELPDEITTLLIDCERDTRFMSVRENKSFSSCVRRSSNKYAFVHSHGVYAFLPDIYTAHICIDSYFNKFIDIFGKSCLPEHLRIDFQELINLENEIVSNLDNKGLTSVSEKVADELSSKYGLNRNNIKIIRGASRFYQSADKEKKDLSKKCGEETYTVGFVGGNLYTKGIIFMKEVLNKLASKGFKIRCVGVGCGNDVGEFLNKGSKYETEIFGKGEINEDFYRSLDAFLNLSVYEAYSLTTLEAMSCGVPVVSSNLNGVFYDAEREDLLLAKVKDISNHDEVASMLEKILCNEDFREKIIESGCRLTRQYTWRDVASEYEGIYQEGS